MTIKNKQISQINLKKFENDELVILRIETEKELKSRGIKFSPGHVGEKVAINFFKNKPGLSNLQKTPPGTKSVDAVSRSGERYSIKTIREGGKSGTVYLDPQLNTKQLFEYLLLVILDEDYELKSLYRFSWEQFWNIKLFDKTMNAWYISKASTRLKQGECIYEKK